MTTNGLTKHAGGRPTLYNETIPQKIEEYLQSTGREQTQLPTVEGLADYLGVTSETIRQWSKEKPEFSLTLKKLVDKQKQQLMDDGLYGGKEVNAAMAIFLLKANHGMKDGSQGINIMGDKVIAILGGASHDSDNGNQEALEAQQEN